MQHSMCDDCRSRFSIFLAVRHCCLSNHCMDCPALHYQQQLQLQKYAWSLESTEKPHLFDSCCSLLTCYLSRSLCHDWCYRLPQVLWRQGGRCECFNSWCLSMKADRDPASVCSVQCPVTGIVWQTFSIIDNCSQHRLLQLIFQLSVILPSKAVLSTQL